MNITNTLAAMDDYDGELDPPLLADESYPPHCDPSSYLDWRFRYASHLVDTSAGEPITHDDEWIQAVIDFNVAHLTGWKSRKHTAVDEALYYAADLRQTDSLEAHLLEARLLAQQTPEEIHSRCSLSTQTITAYSKLHFDVCGIDRKGIWILNPLTLANVPRTDVWGIGSALKKNACFNTSEDFELLVNVLRGLDGKTLASEMPPRTDPTFPLQIKHRFTLAKSLLPDTKPTQRLLARIDEAVLRDVQAGHTTKETVDLFLKALGKAKLPIGLCKEVQQLRDPCTSNGTAEGNSAFEVTNAT